MSSKQTKEIHYLTQKLMEKNTQILLLVIIKAATPGKYF